MRLRPENPTRRSRRKLPALLPAKQAQDFPLPLFKRSDPPHELALPLFHPSQTFAVFDGDRRKEADRAGHKAGRQD